ncbi:hypothetical protein BJ912DRAFT_558401 [Pholiota molesta]|nr:hypothetical protein BJ912DRAFT_558401 [Pholiota molesta]
MQSFLYGHPHLQGKDNNLTTSASLLRCLYVFTHDGRTPREGWPCSRYKGCHVYRHTVGSTYKLQEQRRHDPQEDAVTRQHRGVGVSESYGWCSLFYSIHCAVAVLHLVVLMPSRHASGKPSIRPSLEPPRDTSNLLHDVAVWWGDQGPRITR